MNIELRTNATKKVYDVYAEEPEFMGDMKPARTVVSNQHTCDSRQLDNLIYTWTEKTNWAIGDFKVLLEQVGITAPFNFKNMKGEDSFICEDANGQKVGIRLIEAKDKGSMPQIEVREITKGQWGRSILYDVSPKTAITTDCREAVTCKKVTYFGKDRYLEWFGNKWNLCMAVKYLDQEKKKISWNILKIEMNGLYYNKEDDENQVEERQEKLNQYLLGLRSPINVANVYSEMIEILYPNSDNYCCIEEVKIECVEEVSNAGGPRKMTQVLGEYLINYGDITRYVVNDKGDIYTFEIPEDYQEEDGGSGDDDESDNEPALKKCWTFTRKKGANPIIITRTGKNYKFSTFGSRETIAESESILRNEFISITKRAGTLFDHRFRSY